MPCTSPCTACCESMQMRPCCTCCFCPSDTIISSSLIRHCTCISTTNTYRKSVFMCSFSEGTHEHTFPVGVSGAYTGTMPDETTANDSVTWTETTSTTGAHLHTFTTGGTGGGTGHTHSLTMGALWRPSYVDVICCIRV